MWRRLGAFVLYESLGVALMWTAYVLPRGPGPTIPVLLLLGGLLSCFTGLYHGFSMIPGQRALSFHHWTGRVSAPTSGKEVAIWVVAGPERKQTGQAG